MTAQTPKSSRERADLLETAVRCYLSTILSAADCIAEMCPDVGVPYQQRWRRLPQRLGFDISPEALEASGHMFESDLENFAKLAGRYFSKGLPLIKAIHDDGSRALAAVVDAASSHSKVLETMAESVETAADLDGPPELRDLLEMQAEGLRRYAHQVKSRLLPPLEQLAKLMRQCREVVEQSEADATLDRETGFVNASGFRFELDSYFRDRQHCCVLVIDCETTSSHGEPCSDRDFTNIAAELAMRIGEQFRPVDPVGRIAPRRFAVIFDGEAEYARGRIEQIARSVGGKYIAPSGPVFVAIAMRVIEAVSPDVAVDQLFPPSHQAPAGKAAAD